MSKAKLKKTLSTMPAESLVTLICEMYDSRREARDYLEYWLEPNPDKALEEYKETVHKLFFLPSGGTRKSPSATELKRLQKNFSTLCYDSEKELDLAIWTAEQEYEWILGREGKANTSIPKLMKRIATLRGEMDVSCLEHRFELRISRLEELAKELERNPPVKRRRGWRSWRW
ncbi:MAG: hypothetical protein HDS24_05300 [Bacteroides sp.]|nr:hypothetical protein [Bacteroides sp.]